MIKADPKEFLSKLYRNFHILQERQAKYAGNSPLELINQIDDHKTAIYLTKQAIEDSLSEEEWREALEPLLLAVNNSREIIVVQSPYRDEHYRTALNWDGRTRLREFDLAGRDLSAMDFTDADLTKANLSKSNLTNTKFNGAKLHAVNFNEADLTEADLSEADLSDANLTKAKLSGAKLNSTDLNKVILEESDLNFASLIKSNLSYVKINSSSMYGTELDGARMVEAWFYRTNLTEAKFINADLRDAQFSFCGLVDAKFINANLIGTRFSTCTLSGVDFSEANLINANLKKCIDVLDAKFHDTKCTYGTIWPDNFYSTHMSIPLPLVPPGVILLSPYRFRNSKNVVYYLHQKDEEVPGIGKMAIHYFAREIKEGVLDSVPEGYEVVETERTGMPVLRKKSNLSPPSFFE